MGQAQSIPEPTVGPAKRKKRQESVRVPTAQNNKTRDAFPIPDQWDDNAQFKVVSPASDISNPSQFRGRQYYNSNGTSNHTNHQCMPTSSVRRSRTSKVCPKQAPPKHTNLMQPANFYFGQNETGSEPSDEIDVSHDTSEQIAPASRPNRSMMDLWKAKCAKAKHQFMECFQQSKENSLKQRHFSQRENFHRVPSKDTTSIERPEHVDIANPEASKSYLQLTNVGDFKPIWKELKYQNDPIPPSHSEEAYIKRLSSLASSDSPPTSHDPISPSEIHRPDELDTALQAPDKFPSISDSEQCDESYSPVEGRALSLHSGSLHRQSLRSLTTKSSLSSNETGSTTVIQERPPVFRTITAFENQGEESAQVASNKRAQVRLNQSSEHVLTSDHLHIQNAIQRQIDSTIHRTAEATNDQAQNIEETKGLSRVQRLRMQYQQEIERKANKLRIDSVHGEVSRAQTTQMHFSKPSSFIPKPIASNIETEAKTLTTTNNQEGTGKVYSGPQPQKPDSTHMNSRSTSVPGRVSASFSYSSSNVVTKTSKPLNSHVSDGRRSISAPRDRPSLDGSALLHLTGWNQPWKSNDKKIPALLQVSGWNEKTKNFTNRHSLPAQTLNTSKTLVQPFPKSRQSLPKNYMQSKRQSISSKNSNVHSKQHAETSKESHINPGKEKRNTNALQPLPVNSLNLEKDKVGQCISRTCLEKEKSENFKQRRDQVPQNSQIQRNQCQLRTCAVNTKGRPLALMLQQAYFQTDDESVKAGAVGSPKTSSSLALIEASPAPSVETACSSSTMPMLSEQALTNAGFLFSEPSILRAVKTVHDGQSITTLDSRNRINIFSGKPVDIQARSLEPMIIGEHDDDDGSYRRVRFSEEANEVILPKNVSTFPIESKLSDVTESTVTSRRESHSTNSTSMTIPRIDSIPEEEDEESVIDNKSNTSKYGEEHPTTEDTNFGEKLSNISNVSEGKDPIFEDSSYDKSPEKTPAIMRWSYRTENGLTKGVTPLLGGKTTNYTTNSPYLRFKEAKSRFSGSSVPSKASKVLPIKRSSPVKRTSGSIVTARVAAMEGNHTEPEQKQTLQAINKKVRRATTGQNVLAPRHSKLISPYIKKLHHVQQLERTSGSEILPSIHHKPSSVFPRVEDVINTSSSKDSESISDDEDPFGVILHPTTIDEDSCQTSGDCDDFDALLNQESDDETVESSVQPSIATILQHRPPIFKGSRRISQESTNSIVSSQRSGFASDNISTYSSTSSMGDTASVPTVLRRRSSVFSPDENSLPSTVGGRIKVGALPFRDAAPVKPNEQVHRTVPGSSCLSSMQKTPLEARTWRALAAAAQGKEKGLLHTTANGRSGRSSLSERNPNIIGR